MAVRLTDNDIIDLINEEKLLPEKWHTLLRWKSKKGHREKEISLSRSDGSFFTIIFRQNDINILDFSIILGYIAPKSNVVFRLKRYNGKSHFHTNQIEKNSFYDYHIHVATECYQLAGFYEDGYAEISSEYSDIDTAMDVLVKDCNIILPEEKQMKLFS